VTLTDTTPSSSIYYTTDGSYPTTNSTLYNSSTPILVDSSETINAVAFATGDLPSAEASAAFSFGPPAPVPTISPVTGAYPTNPLPVTITDSLSGASIYYTTDGTTPTTNSTPYPSGGISLATSAQTIVQAIATKAAYSVSPVASATYAINQTVPSPVINPNGGASVYPLSVTISDSLPGAAIYYTTDGTTPTTSSTLYNGLLTVSISETIEAISVKPAT
jgi:hypothetical protein